MSLETMQAFFTARTEGYDAHMLSNVEGCKEGYSEMAKHVAAHYQTISKHNRDLPLIDLGCGTGLQLEAILPQLPNLKVTAVDLTQSMLDQLTAKLSEYKITTHCASYFDMPLEPSHYGCAISFQTMHHFNHQKKAALYQKIHNSLVDGGIYVECDYMVMTQAEEDTYFQHYAQLVEAPCLDSEALFHYDTPCSIDNQIKLLEGAGFSTVELVYRQSNTTMLIARR